MTRRAQEKATARPDSGTDAKPRSTHHGTLAVTPRDPDRAGKPVEADREQRSQRADVGEAAEQGGSGEDGR